MKTHSSIWMTIYLLAYNIPIDSDSLRAPMSINIHSLWLNQNQFRFHLLVSYSFIFIIILILYFADFHHSQ